MGVDLLSFIVFAGAMVATPGPANMVLLAAGARFGLRPALPFVLGVALGKQAVIWPVGFGLLTVVATVPWLFTALKFASAGYILYLAWRIAGARIAPGQAGDVPPSLAAGLAVHPLNPKAWALIATGFTNFVSAGTPPLTATAIIAACLLAIQLLLHPLWCWGGARLSTLISGGRGERALMLTLAALTVASVLLVLAKGDI